MASWFTDWKLYLGVVTVYHNNEMLLLCTKYNNEMLLFVEDIREWQHLNVNCGSRCVLEEGDTVKWVTLCVVTMYGVILCIGVCVCVLFCLCFCFFRKGDFVYFVWGGSKWKCCFVMCGCSEWVVFCIFIFQHFSICACWMFYGMLYNGCKLFLVVGWCEWVYLWWVVRIGLNEFIWLYWAVSCGVSGCCLLGNLLSHVYAL